MKKKIKKKEISKEDNNEASEPKKYRLEEDPYKEEKEKQNQNEKEVLKREEVKDPTPIRHNIESRRNQIFSDEDQSKKTKEEKPIKIESPLVTENNFQNTLKALINKEEKKKEPPKPQPTNIRKQETIKVNLTKKMIPTFAARESLSKEPPYPKSKKRNMFQKKIIWDKKLMKKTQFGQNRREIIFIIIKIIEVQLMHIIML